MDLHTSVFTVICLIFGSFFVQYRCANSDIDNCPLACMCSIKLSTKGVLVNCTAQNLSNVPGIFPTNTEELYLDHNDIKNFDSDSLPILPKLQRLIISHNPLTTVFMDAEVNGRMPKVETLDLTHNELPQVPLNLPKSLRVLHLSYNRIQDIRGSSFSTLRKLRELYLDHNHIRKITERTFHGDSEDDITLPNLDKLSLKKNRIQFIAPKAFENLISLTALNLARNKLSSLEVKAFYRLLDLEHLDLHGNRIETIEDETFYMLKGLRFLSLKSNSLTSVPRGLPMLEWLDLSHNLIRNITSDQKTDIYPAELFILAHNPLHCDCHLLWLKEIFDRREYLLKHIDLAPSDFIPTCASPSRVKGESWDNLGDDMFVCNPGDDQEIYDDPRGRVDLTINYGKITDKSVEISWSIKGKPGYESVFLQYYIFGMRSSSIKHIEISAAQREYTLRHLQSDSNYIICIIPKLSDSTEYTVEKMKPLSYDHCIEVTTTAVTLLDNVSFIAVASYYMLGMMGTIIAIFSCIGGLALIYGLWNAKCSDWSAKYAVEAPMPDLDLHNKLSEEEELKKSAKNSKEKSDVEGTSESEENKKDL